MFLLFKQKTAYEVRISDWSSDVCSSDLYRNNKAGGLSAPASLERKEWRRHVQAPCVEVQDQPPPRGQSLGPPQEPGQQARVRPRPARPAPPQADRLRHPNRKSTRLNSSH